METLRIKEADSWGKLRYWDCGEWQVVEERLYRTQYNPGRGNLFRALELVPLEKVQVCWIGQDPYPDSRMATGVAFSIPPDVAGFPPTLKTIFTEYEHDLHFPCPSSGDLTPWANRGVLLWNYFPSCARDKSMSHDWFEWEYLTQEIVEELCKQGIVFILSGSVARRCMKIINEYELISPGENKVIETAHPAAGRYGKKNAKNLFEGSRVFTRANDALVSLGRDAIDWRLP